MATTNRWRAGYTYVRADRPHDRFVCFERHGQVCGLVVRAARDSGFYDRYYIHNIGSARAGPWYERRMTPRDKRLTVEFLVQEATSD